MLVTTEQVEIARAILYRETADDKSSSKSIYLINSTDVKLTDVVALIKQVIASDIKITDVVGLIKQITALYTYSKDNSVW